MNKNDRPGEDVLKKLQAGGNEGLTEINGKTKKKRVRKPKKKKDVADVERIIEVEGEEEAVSAEVSFEEQSSEQQSPEQKSREPPLLENNSPEIKSPELNLHELNPPELNPTELNLPELNLPELNPPEIKSESTRIQNKSDEDIENHTISKQNSETKTPTEDWVEVKRR